MLPTSCASCTSLAVIARNGEEVPTSSSSKPVVVSNNLFQGSISRCTFLLTHLSPHQTAVKAAVLQLEHGRHIYSINRPFPVSELYQVAQPLKFLQCKEQVLVA